jgi:hypothetical protein
MDRALRDALVDVEVAAQVAQNNLHLRSTNTNQTDHANLERQLRAIALLLRETFTVGR